jgi:hypothetical protein
MKNSIKMKSKTLLICTALAIGLSASMPVQAAQGSSWLGKITAGLGWCENNWGKVAVGVVATVGACVLWKKTYDWLFNSWMRSQLGHEELLSADIRSANRAKLSEDEKRNIDTKFSTELNLEKTMVQSLNLGANVDTPIIADDVHMTKLALWAALDLKLKLTIIPLLIKAGADVNAHDSLGNTALINAVNYHNSRTTQFLLQIPSIDVDAHNTTTRKTALDLAKTDQFNNSVGMLEHYNRAQQSLPDAITLSKDLKIHHPFIKVAQPIIFMHKTLVSHLPPDLVNIVKDYMGGKSIQISAIQAHLKKLRSLNPQTKETWWGTEYCHFPQPLDPAAIAMFDEEAAEQKRKVEAQQIAMSSASDAPMTSLSLR